MTFFRSPLATVLVGILFAGTGTGSFGPAPAAKAPGAGTRSDAGAKET
jgi:hypothetical protein